MIIFCIEFLTQPKNAIALCSEKLKLSIFMAAPNWFIGISVWIHLLLIVFYTQLIKDQHYCCLYWPFEYKKCLKSSRGVTKSIGFFMLLFIPTFRRMSNFPVVSISSISLRNKWNTEIENIKLVYQRNQRSMYLK